MEIVVVGIDTVVSHTLPVGVIKTIASLERYPFEAVCSGSAEIHFGHSQPLGTGPRSDGKIHLIARVGVLVSRGAKSAMSKENAQVDLIERRSTALHV